MDGPNCEIDRLPEACISQVLSFTSPRDSCRAAVVSPTFRQAADSDIVWRRFLPPDYPKILSRAVDSVSFSSCKELYFKLCDLVLIDGGKKVFSLEKETGAKCFTVGAKELYIPWVHVKGYWNWVSHPESRFTEVAKLLDDCWLKVRCSINSSELSPNTTYKSYLIFKLDQGAFGLTFPLQEVSVELGTQICEGKVCIIPDGQRDLSPEVRVPQGRSDGWMEVELGEFYNEDGSEGDVTMFFERGRTVASGLIVEGVQVRPK